MDIVGAAETGSGKTLAFGIPIIQGILEDRKYEADNVDTGDEKDDNDDDVPLDDVNGYKASQETAVNVVDNVDLDFDLVEDEDIQENAKTSKGDKLRAVVLTPTRELALQIYKHILAVAGGQVGVVVVVGGLSVEKQIRLLYAVDAH